MAKCSVDQTINSLINKRLAYMKDVAGHKAHNHMAIEDLTQERKVLEKAVIDANSLGIEGKTVVRFMQAQMDVAKAIQYRYRADWLSVPEIHWKPRPLDEVRAKIGQLNYALLQKLAERLKFGGDLTSREKDIFMQDLQQRNLNEEDKQLLWDGLQEVSLQ